MIVTSDPYKVSMVKRLANGADRVVIIDDNFKALRRLLQRVRGLGTIHLERYRPVSAGVKKGRIGSVSNLFQADRCLTKGMIP